MSTRRFPWARASISTSAGLVLGLSLGAAAWSVGAAAPPAASPESSAALALELELARDKDLYLRLDPAQDLLEVKARGIVLESIPLKDVAFFGYQLMLAPDPPPVKLPVVRTVTVEASADYRRLIAPDELVPYDPDATPESTTDEEPESPKAPESYRIQLDDGWVLDVGQELPATGLGSRLGQALASGWADLWGRSTATPQRIAVALGAEDAQRLHHLFRTDTRILIARGSAPPVSP